jgi:hypothetical protein
MDKSEIWVGSGPENSRHRAGARKLKMAILSLKGLYSMVEPDIMS